MYPPNELIQNNKYHCVFINMMCFFYVIMSFPSPSSSNVPSPLFCLFVVLTIGLFVLPLLVSSLYLIHYLFVFASRFFGSSNYCRGSRMWAPPAVAVTRDASSVMFSMMMNMISMLMFSSCLSFVIHFVFVNYARVRYW